MGTDDLFAYVEKYNVTLDSHYDDILGQHPKKKWDKFMNHSNEPLVSEEALDLLDSMLRYDHAERITPKESMDQPYFKQIRENAGK